MSAETAETSTIEPMEPAQRGPRRVGAAIAALVVTAFYAATMCRWIGLGDTALVLDEMLELKLNSHVNNHRWAIVFGWLFTKLPFGELAFRANLMSVFFGSLAMLLMYFVAFHTLKRPTLALGATAAAAVMHSMWWHSTIVENYAINAVMLLTTMLLLYRDEERSDSRCYYLACVVAGLAIVNHVQMATLSIAVFVYAILQRRKGSYGLIRRWLYMAGCFLVGFTPYLVILMRDIGRVGDFRRVIYWATGGDFQSRMFDFDPAKVFRPLVTEFLVQFPSPMLLFIGFGVYWIGERAWYAKANVAITVIFLVNTFFFSLFHTWDKFAFLLPSFLVAAYWGIAGMRGALDLARDGGARRRWLRPAVYAGMLASVLIPPFVYRHLAVWGAEEGFWHGRFNNNYTHNTHNCATYIANPDKSGWRDVDAFAELLFAALPPNAIYFDDDSRNYYPLHDYYQRRYGKRPDVRILMMNTWGFDNWGLSEQGFTDNAVVWLRQGRPVFMTTIDKPMDGITRNLAARGIVAKRHDLDADHWIYRLEYQASGRLRVHDVMMGRRFDAKTPVLANAFAHDDIIGARVRFAATEEAMQLSFRWRDPAGEAHYQSPPFALPAGSTDVWSHLDDAKPRVPGRWQVELVSDDAVLASHAFDVR